MDASRDSSPDILGDNDEDRSSGAPLDSPTADSDAERPLSSTQMTQSISQSCSGSGGSPSPGLRFVQSSKIIAVVGAIHILRQVCTFSSVSYPNTWRVKLKHTFD